MDPQPVPAMLDDLARLRLHRSPPPPRRRWSVALALVAVAAVAGAAVMLTARWRDRVFPVEVNAGTITRIVPGDRDAVLVASGYVTARQRATLNARVAGRIAELLVDEGGRVHAGDAIARLDADDARASRLQLRADVAAARMRVEHARAELAEADMRHRRAAELLAAADGTRADVDDMAARRDIARAHLREERAALRAVRARRALVDVELAKTYVTAPFAGTVVRLQASAGETVTPASPVATVMALDELELQVDVAEGQVARLQPDMPVTVTIDALPERRLRGQLQAVRGLVDRARATVSARVRLLDTPAGLLPDMAGKASFLARAPASDAAAMAARIMAPTDAIITRDGAPAVFVIADGRARLERLTTGARSDEWTEITAGPPVGTQVIRKPSPELRDGTRVSHHD